MRADRICLLATLVLITAGCAGPAPGDPAEPVSSTSAAAPSAGPQDPAALVGAWTVRSGNEPAGAAWIDAGSMRVRQDCTILSVQWKAGPTGLFVAAAEGFQEGERTRGCRPDTTGPAWFATAVAFRAQGGKHLLLGADGTTVAELTPLEPGSKPGAPIDLGPADPSPPVITDDARRALRQPGALPAGLTPADPQRLTGRWVPAAGTAPAARKAHVELARDGTWTGSDGCNTNGGRWVADPTGALLAVAGPQTEIGCDNSRIMGWLGDARAAGFEGDVLVLAGPDGAVAGKLRRQG